MSTKFQQLFQQIMEDNSVGGALGTTDAWSPTNIDKVDTRATMSVVGKNKKKKKFPLIKRRLPGGL
jgi:hypothetical protein